MKADSSLLVDEYRTWHTPVIGAYLLYLFTEAYKGNHPEGRAPIVILHFITAAILTDDALADKLKRKTSLVQYVRHARNGDTSLHFMKLHERTRSRFSYTARAIDIAVAGGYLKWDVDSASLTACKLASRPGSGDFKTGRIKELGERAKLLGRIMARTTLPKTAELLGVSL